MVISRVQAERRNSAGRRLTESATRIKTKPFLTTGMTSSALSRPLVLCVMEYFQR